MTASPPHSPYLISYRVPLLSFQSIPNLTLNIRKNPLIQSATTFQLKPFLKFLNQCSCLCFVFPLADFSIQKLGFSVKQTYVASYLKYSNGLHLHGGKKSKFLLDLEILLPDSNTFKRNLTLFTSFPPQSFPGCFSNKTGILLPRSPLTCCLLFPGYLIYLSPFCQSLAKGYFLSDLLILFK